MAPKNLPGTSRLFEALVELTGKQALGASAGIADFSEIMGRALKSGPVRFWRLTSEALLVWDEGEVAGGSSAVAHRLSAADCPLFFEAMKKGEVVAARNCREDPQAGDVAAFYPADLVSLLAAPVSCDGKLVGVVCVEQVEEPREWLDEERLFLQGAADLLGLAAGAEIQGRGNVRRAGRDEAKGNLLVRVAEAASIPVGDSFLEELTKRLIETLSVSGAAVLLTNPEDRDHLRAKVMIIAGERVDQELYDLAGTPCADILRDGVRIIERNVQGQYPSPILERYGIEAYGGAPLTAQSGEVLGLVAIFSKTPLKEVESIRAALLFFAARAAAEVERRASEEQLQGMMRRQNLVLESAGEGICGLDGEGRVIFKNGAARAILGWEAGELIGQDFYRAVQREPHDECPVFQTLRDGESRRVDDEVFYRKDGSSFPAEYVCSPVFDEKTAAVVGVVVTFRDIAERKQWEFRLARLNRLYEMLSRTNAAVIRSKKKQESYEAVCRIAVEVGSFRMAAVAGPNGETGEIEALTTFGEDRGYFPEVQLNVTEAARSKGTIGTALRTGAYDVCNDIAGDPRMARWRDSARKRGYRSVASFPIRIGPEAVGVLVLFSGEENYFQQDEIDLLTAVAADISYAAESIENEERRQRAEESLAALQRQQALILDSLSEGIHVLDTQGRVAFANPTGLRMLGWESGELIGEHSHSAIHHHLCDGSDYPVEECPAYKTLRDGQKRRVDDEVFFRKDGTSFPVEYVCAPMRDGEGTLVGAVMTFRDISARKKIEREKQVVIDSLGERVKELKAMHRIGSLLRQEGQTVQEVLEQVAVFLTEGMQYPECTAAQLEFDSIGGQTPNFRPTRWSMRGKFVLPDCALGRVRIVYLEPKPLADLGPFLREEKALIEWTTEALSSYFERARAERNARESQALLQMASAVGKMGAWSIEIPGLEPRLSEETFAIYELTAGTEVTVEELIHFYVPEDRERIRKVFERCVEVGTAFDEELQLTTAKGRTIWVRSIGEAVRDVDGKILRVQGAIQDIDERRQMESSLAVSGLRLRQLVESMPMTVWMATPEGEVDYVNHHFYEYSGFAEAEPLGSGWQTVVHPNDLERFAAAWRTCVQAENPFESECRVRGRDSSYRWFHIQAVPVRAPDGSLFKWYGTAIDIHETKELEERTVQLAQRLTTTLESITDGFFLLNHDWRFTYVNPEAEKLLERKRDDLLGENVWEKFPEAVDATFYREYHRAVEDEITVAFEEYLPVLRKWFDVKAYPSDEGLAVYFQDVTERHRADQALRQSEERFRYAVKATRDVIWDWNGETGELWWSEALEKQFGYPKDAFPPTLDAWSSLIHPDERDAVADSLQEAIDSGSTEWMSEYRYRRKDGTYAFVLDRGYIIRDEAGNVTRMIGGMVDLTERRRHEEKLREQAALLDKAQDAIIVRDLEHRILYWNKSAERLYGWPPGEVVGKSIRQLLYAEDDRFLEATNKVLAKGEWTGELEQYTRDGDTVLVEGRWTLVRDDKDRPTSILAINTDISERKKLEAQILRAQRVESIGALAGGVAHDLNNILAPICMGVDLLKSEETDERRQKLLSTILGSARRGSDLVAQVLAFSRGVEGKRSVLNLRSVVEDVEQIVRDTFPKNIQLMFEIEEDLWAVNADSTQLHQVLMNLCVNARDAMEQGGPLEVTVKNVVLDEVYSGMNPDANPGPYVLIRVIDSGPGIARKIRDKIFDPFFTTKETGKGTGLGLSTVLTIVKSHGGFVNVYSESDKGAKFKVYLPALANEQAVEDVTMERANLPRGSGELILIVDDEAAIREVTRKTLERFHYRVMTACNGAEAVALYAKHMDEVAVVLTDMAMPVMDGPATVIALKAMNPEVRIIGSSGLPANGNVAKAIGAGVEEFIPKPYAVDSLLKAIHKVVKE